MTSMINRILVLVISLVMLQITATRAWAEAADEAHLRSGVSFLIANKNAEALEQFRKAYELVPSPRAAAQMGLAERALGLWSESEQHLQEALAASTDPWIARNRKYIEAQLAQVSPQLGTLDIAGPPGAVVTIDGARKGQLPKDNPARLVAGSHLVELALAGHEPYSRRISIRAGKTEELSVELTPLPEPAPRHEIALPVAAAE